MQLQYITQEIPEKPHWQLAEEACLAGIDWIQLRVKNKGFDEWLQIAQKTKEVTNKYGAKLIINDSPEIAISVKADGLHLGKQDMPLREVRKLIPEGLIIGGTANTFDDMQRLVSEDVSYIGLGPFRFTKTKEKLSPILGLSGYQSIMQKCLEANIKIPIIAIGGILPNDVAAIMATGVNGIAVSSTISLANDKRMIVSEFKSQMSKIFTRQ